MGYQTIQYACGHTDQQQMYGTHTARVSRAEYLGRNDCPSCRKEKSAKQAADSGLPMLHGSDKQIVWATSIRAKMLNDIQKALASQPNPGAPKEFIPALAHAASKLRDNTSAAWWIEHRDLDLSSVKPLAFLLLFGTTNPDKSHPLYGITPEATVATLKAA